MCKYRLIENNGNILKEKKIFELRRALYQDIRPNFYRRNKEVEKLEEDKSNNLKIKERFIGRK